jgi:hypothetical protein
MTSPVFNNDLIQCLRRKNMKLNQSLVIPLLVAVCLAQPGQDDLGSEMAKLHVETALLIPSQEIDEFPVWSPDSRFLAINITGQWFKFDTLQVRLQKAKWHGERIGAADSKPKMQSVSGQEVDEWAKQNTHGDSKVVSKSGIKAEIQRSVEGVSASLVVSQGARSTVIWKTILENCGALSISPNDKYLALICELNGVLVVNLNQASQVTQSQR